MHAARAVARQVYFSKFLDKLDKANYTDYKKLPNNFILRLGNLWVDVRIFAFESNCNYSWP